MNLVRPFPLPSSHKEHYTHNNPRSLRLYCRVYLFWVGLATRLPQPKDLIAYAESCMYSPNYRSYRWMRYLVLVTPVSSSWCCFHFSSFLGLFFSFFIPSEFIMKLFSLFFFRWPFFFVLFWRKFLDFLMKCNSYVIGCLESCRELVVRSVKIMFSFAKGCVLSIIFHITRQLRVMRGNLYAITFVF